MRMFRAIHHNLQYLRTIDYILSTYHVVDGKQDVVCLLVEGGHFQSQLEVLMKVLQIRLDLQPPANTLHVQAQTLSLEVSCDLEVI